MKNRWTALLLSLILMFSLCVPALAAEDRMDHFTPVNTYADNFPDVKATDWFYGSVKTCYEYGLMEGSNGQFHPSGNLTVAQALVMADRIHSIYTTGTVDLTNGDPWYQPYVDYALANGIIVEGDFDSYTTEITRAQMAYIFSRALPAEEYIPINEMTAYPPDVAEGSPYSANILTLYKSGVITGNDAYGTFRPNSPIARREAAAILARIAIRDQRKSFCMMKDFRIDDALTILAPAGADLVHIGEGEYQLEHGFLFAHLSVERDSLYENVSVLQIPAEMMAEILNSSMEGAFPGSTVTTGAEITAFGDVPAYLMDYSIAMPEEAYGAVTARGYACFFMADSALYSVNYVTACPGTECPAELLAELTTMVNGLTVGGKTSALKVK